MRHAPGRASKSRGPPAARRPAGERVNRNVEASMNPECDSHRRSGHLHLSHAGPGYRPETSDGLQRQLRGPMPTRSPAQRQNTGSRSGFGRRACACSPPAPAAYSFRAAGKYSRQLQSRHVRARQQPEQRHGAQRSSRSFRWCAARSQVGKRNRTHTPARFSAWILAPAMDARNGMSSACAWRSVTPGPAGPRPRVRARCGTL